MVLRAKTVGKALATHLKALSATDGFTPELFLIGHSLGCRLILEALQSYDASTLRIRGLCLMAAAVPTSDVEPGAALSGAAAMAAKTCVMFSPVDDVLLFPFRLGELAATMKWVEAVGRHGQPEEVWRKPGKTRLRTSLKHNDYFRGKGPLSLGPSVTASPIGEVLGRSVSRELPSIEVATDGWTLPKWTCARSNYLGRSGPIRP